MYLSKACDCILHDFLAPKLHAYGLSEDAVIFGHSYSKRKKQSVKINDTESVFQILLSGIYLFIYLFIHLFIYHIIYS